MTVLTSISNVTKKTLVDEIWPTGNKAFDAFNRYEKRNSGFIFDLFFGQLSISTTCRRCTVTINETFQLFKTLPLPIAVSGNSVELLDCIHRILAPSEVEMEEAVCRCNGYSNEFIQQYTITHAPKYLFIYINRGSYVEGGLKNNTAITSNADINLPTKDGDVPYKLISVIDHIGNNDGGHYYIKCNYEKDVWWLINDEQVERIDFKISTKNCIVFMFKKMLKTDVIIDMEEVMKGVNL